MKFWGVEVKAGEPLAIESGEFLLHISQASLGEAKKDKTNESVYLNLNVNGKKLVLGTLSSDKFPQISLDLVFDRDFELSHNWKHGSVYFTGYRVPKDDETSDSGTDDEVLRLPAAVNHGRKETENVQVKPGSSGGKKVKIVEPGKDEEDVNSSDEAYDDSSDDQDESDEDEEESDGESDEQAKAMPKTKVDLKKKRPAKSSVKTPVSDKKAKLVTPQKTEGKTPGARVATPYPSKQASKAPASTSSDQKKDQIAKPFMCKSCNKSFGSDNALQSHNKAKHSS